MVLRDKDANVAWTTASDATLEQRRYHCQNWRADVVALITEGAIQTEQARYAAYGTPFNLPAGDTDADGDCDPTDSTKISSWWSGGAGAYDVRGDLDLDGDVDFTDTAQSTTATFQASGGKGVLSKSAVGPSGAQVVDPVR